MCLFKHNAHHKMRGSSHLQAISFEEIEQRYGPGVRRIVEGETKFSKIGNIEGGCSKADLKALDLQQLFLAMTEEVRIIVVKLADRLHNMRTLGSMAPEKQQKIAAETLQASERINRGHGCQMMGCECPARLKTAHCWILQQACICCSQAGHSRS